MMNLSNHVKITKVKDHTTAATSAVESDPVDMQGYEGVMFVTSFGTAAANNTILAAQDVASGGSYTDLLGTSVSSGTSDEDVWIDVYRPSKRYVRVEIARGTSSTLESIYAIQYGARVLPVSNVVSGTIIGELHVSPAEGTA
jgi:hypothetical protein